jgi:hypothetical protein
MTRRRRRVRHARDKLKPIGTLMPHGSVTVQEEVPAGVNPSLFGAKLLFRDAAGVRWRPRPGGNLDDCS